MTDNSPARNAIERVAMMGARTKGANRAVLFMARGRGVEVFDPAPAPAGK